MTRVARVLWALAAVVGFWSFGFARVRSEDLWWHLAGGEWTVAHHAIPLSDPFSFTAIGRPWLNDAWLADLVFVGWTRLFGLEALAWWKWAVVVATFLVLMRTCARLADGDLLAAWLATVLGAAVAAPFLDIRPQLYSFLGTAVVLELTLARPRMSPLLPLVFAVWANLHAGFLFGLVALAIGCGARTRTALAQEHRTAMVRVGSARAWRYDVPVVALAIAACLVNPNGIRVFTRPLAYALDVGSPFRSLMEWRPPFEPGGVESAAYAWAIAAFVLATSIALALPATRRHRTTWAAIVLGAVALGMSLTSRRFVPLFGLLQAPVVAIILLHGRAAVVRWSHTTARALRGGPGEIRAHMQPLRTHPDGLAPWVGPDANTSARGRTIVAALLPSMLALIFGAIGLAPYPLSSLAFHFLAIEDAFPVDTCNFIAANGLAGNVFAQYGWAGYVTYRTAGRLAVFIDGRADAVYPGETFTRYHKIGYGEDDWFGILSTSGADYLLWPRFGTWRRLPAALVASGRWRRLHEDAVSILLARADRMPVAPLRPAPDSPWRDYALGVFALERGDLMNATAQLARAVAAAPYLRDACDQLARAHLRAGGEAAAWRTIAACQRIFPVPNRLEWFQGMVHAAASASPHASPSAAASIGEE